MPDDKKRTRNYDKSPEGIAYRNKYRKEHYANISISIPFALRGLIDEKAQEEGISRTQLIIDAVADYLAVDKADLKDKKDG